jgi:hypothetical protein
MRESRRSALPTDIFQTIAMNLLTYLQGTQVSKATGQGLGYRVSIYIFFSSEHAEREIGELFFSI